MHSGTILDASEHRQPSWWSLRKRVSPTALQLASDALEETRRELLEQKHKAEYHSALVVMLQKREARLGQDIAKLSKSSAKAPEQSASDQPS